MAPRPAACPPTAQAAALPLRCGARPAARNAVAYNVPMGENEANMHDVILLPTQGQVLEFRKRAACGGVAPSAPSGGFVPAPAPSGGSAPASAPSRRGDPLFGVAVSTFDAWVADLWELYGDGRVLVSPMERQLAMAAAFGREDLAAAFAGAEAPGCAGGAWERDNAAPAEGALPCGPAHGGVPAGTVALAARCAREGAGLREFDGAVAAVREGRAGAAPGALAPAEEALLAGVAVYFDVLDGLGLVEQGAALPLLAGALSRGREVRVLAEGFPPPTLQQRRFFEACPQLRLTWREAPGAGGVARPPEGVRVRFAFPAGRYARPLLLADLAVSLREGGCTRTVLACADAAGTYEALAPALAREGVACSLRTRVRFPETDFGRVLLALHRLAAGGAPSREDLVDALYSPLLGLPAAQVRRIDARLRGDRLADVRQECAALRAAGGTFSYLEELACDPEAVVVAGALEDAIRALPGVSEAYRHEQLGALGCVREAFSAACRLGLGAGACMAALEVASVDVSRTGPSGAGAPRGVAGIPEGVFVCDRERAAALPARSCDALVLCDMTSANWPVADREDAGDALFAKLGLHSADDALAHARRTFAALESLPSRELVVERCLFDAAAEPTYPAMVVEELVDCYRDDPAATDDIDNPYALPPALREGLVERGEERLGENLAASRVPRPVEARAARPAPGEVRPERRGLVVLPRGGREGGETCLSASQIESYLACPCLWFVQRRLRVQPLDEEFGPLQMGDFAHHALEGFYRAFWERTGARKVGPQTLGEARAVMGEVLAAQQALQPLLKPSDNRLVPTSELEVREMDALKARLVRYLDFEAQLLPGFHPAHLEYEVGVHERVEYAGVRLVGKVDRIDVDDAGHAVVIDYKGSLSADYELAGDAAQAAGAGGAADGPEGAGAAADAAAAGAPCVPAKVQTLVYAQVVRRLLGLDVVGALYVCYGREPRLAGAYDARVLETPHLPNMRHARCACPPEGEGSFADLLDATERRAAQAVRALLSGEVNPAPAGPSSCTWCPVSSCAWREGR